jgi:hypothetical protein
MIEILKMSSYLSIPNRPYRLLLFEIALVLVRFDHIASVIVNANNSTM